MKAFTIEDATIPGCKVCMRFRSSYRSNEGLLFGVTRRRSNADNPTSIARWDADIERYKNNRADRRQQIFEHIISEHGEEES